MSLLDDPETIQIHIIWRGKLDVFSVAQGESTKQQILFASAKLNQTLTNWAKDLGIAHESLRKRLKNWSIEDALTKEKTI